MEKTIGETRVYTGKIIKVRVDEVQLDDGRVTVREVCEHPGGVAVLPLLPTVPFLLLAALGFAKSSERLHTWFTGTKLYKNNLESYVRGEGMTAAAKRRIMLTVTALMAVGFALMMRKELYILCIILACVWVGHVIYFVFGVKTCRSAPIQKEESGI